MNFIQNIDVSIVLWIQNTLRSDSMTTFWSLITCLGNGGAFWIVSAVFLLCFKKTRPVGITALVSLMLCNLATNLILKELFARPRPFQYTDAVIPLIKNPGDYSFPSGHTSASFSCAFIYYRMLPEKYGIPSILLASMIAFSRIYLGVHYPTDILGGILVACISSRAAWQATHTAADADKKE